MKKIILVLFIISLVVTGCGKSPRRQLSPAPQGQTARSQNEQKLLELEQQLQIALKSGGISPEAYTDINKQLQKLEAGGADAEKIKSLRATMSQLDVGGSKSQQAQTQVNNQKNQPKIAAKGTPTDAQSTSQVPPLTNPISQTPPVPAPTPSKPEAKPTCISNTNPVFTHHVTNVSKINYVVPPPTIGAGPSLKTHGYLGTDHARVPIYAPVDMVLETGAYFIGGPYWLGFQVSCEVKMRIGHITEPIQAIKDLFPITPATDSRDQEIKNPLALKAGDLIGYTTGTSQAGNWDIGVYNLTYNNKYLGDATWGNSWVYTSAVCPFDYFPENMRSLYTSKFNYQFMPGNPADGESFCK